MREEQARRGGAGDREEKGVAYLIAIGGRGVGDWISVPAPVSSDSRKAGLILSLVFSPLHIDFFLRGLLFRRLTRRHYTCS